MGKMSSEKDGGDLPGTPANVELAARKRGSINLIGNHLEKADGTLGSPDDITSHDENEDEISSLGSEKGGLNISTEIKIQRDSPIAAADSTWPGCRSWNMVPKVEVDLKPLDVPAPVTPVSVTTEHEKRMTPPKEMERREDVSKQPCLPETSAKEIKQFTYECKEGVKKSSRRSLKCRKDLTFDETDGNHVEFCFHADELDPSKLYELHYKMFTFGKVFCTERNPNCNMHAQ